MPLAMTKIVKSAKLMGLLSQKYWTGASNLFADCGSVAHVIMPGNPLTSIKKNQRVPLVTNDGIPVQTVAQAMAELKRLQTQRSDNTLPTLAQTPKFNEYSARYLEFIGSGQGTKKLGTVAKEKALLKRWNNYIGGLRLDQIKRVHGNRFIESRLKENVSLRTQHHFRIEELRILRALAAISLPFETGARR